MWTRRQAWATRRADLNATKNQFDYEHAALTAVAAGQDSPFGRSKLEGAAAQHSSDY